MLKNIIFDLGGVILNIDFQKTVEAFRKLGIADIDKMYSGYAQYDFFDAFDKGLISPLQFRDKVRTYIPKSVTNEEIDEAWNKMLLDFPAERINLLLNLKKTYRTFLLSNTNAIHYPVYNKQLHETFGIDSLSDLFEKAYYSFQVGLRKPDIEIFELVLKENNLVPEETLFIDDAPQNIKIAKYIGIKAVLLQPSETLIDLFENIN